MFRRRKERFIIKPQLPPITEKKEEGPSFRNKDFELFARAFLTKRTKNQQ